MLEARSLDFALGKALFDRLWTSAPASTQATDGLGPLFNARSCVACHPRNGRGKISLDEQGNLGGLGYVLRLGNEDGGVDPTYGMQFQTNAIQGQKPEGRVSYNDVNYAVQNLAYGSMAENTNIAGRLSQPLYGLGLLEQVSDAAILAHADPMDENADGISGRANMFKDPNGKTVLGRFAWKASAATLRDQAANAFLNDIGLSTSLHPKHAGDCSAMQKICLQGPHGDSAQYDDLEVSDEMLDLVTVYLRLIKPLKTSPIEGGDLFVNTGCASCHIPELPLPKGGSVAAYSDLLLHDMGAALADGIKEGDASGHEWRTQPLWGTGQTTRMGLRFLHDGRAKFLDEAILWHGGEAEAAKQAFLALPLDEREKLINFLNSL